MDPFLGEIRMNAFAFAPQGWAQCNGQTLAVNQNQALYSLLHNTYGGTSTSFNLPDLRGRTPVGMGMSDYGTSYYQGGAGGAESVVVTTSQMPIHSHQPSAIGAAATKASPSNNFYAQGPTAYVASPVGSQLVGLNSATIGEAGANAAHNNMQATLVLNFCIALTGIYPPRQ